MLRETEYEKLTIQNSFIFTKVMEDPHLLKELLRRILPGLPEGEMYIVKKERTTDPFTRPFGIRALVFTEDDKHLFSVEILMGDRKNLRKQARYCQALADMESNLSVSECGKLKDQYIIFICPFDPFDGNMLLYTVRNICHETGKELGDGTTKIFINCTGENSDEYPLLKPFADYVMGIMSDDAYTAEVDRSVRMARKNPLWRKEYMDIRELQAEAKREGRQEGRAEGIRDNSVMMLKNMMEEGFSYVDACRILKLDEEEFRSLVQ